jgi:F-type H+-transporting ATPase subunit epsilon
MPLHFELITPERVLYQTDAERVTLPTTEGDITVLPHHAALVAALAPGVATLVTSAGTEEVAVSGGFIEISEGQRVRVLADTAERGIDLDLSVIQEARERAEQLMNRTIHTDDVSYAAAAAALERELARERVARRAHLKRGIPTLDAAHLPKDANPV